MQQDQSVKDLRSRFDGLSAKPKPLLATKPQSTSPSDGNGAKPMPKSTSSSLLHKGDDKDSPQTLKRTITNDSELSDPFGSPVQSSPSLPVSGFKPVPLSRKPRLTLQKESPEPLPTTLRPGVRDRSPESIIKLSVLVETAGPNRSSSTKPPPPPPSPRVRSPRPKISTESLRPAPLEPRNIFLEFAENAESKRERPTFTRQHSSDTCTSSASRSASRSTSATAPELPPNRPSMEVMRPMPTRSGMITPRATSPGPEMPTPTRSTRQAEIERRPALPSRPVSLLHSADLFSHSNESASMKQYKPELPKRIKTVDCGTIDSGPVEKSNVPRLPSRQKTIPSQPSQGKTDSRILHEEEVNEHEPSALASQTPAGYPVPDTKRAPISSVVQLDSDDEEEPAGVMDTIRSAEQPDASTANRKPPRFKGTHWELLTAKEIRKTALSGDLLIIAHADKVKLHNLLTDEITWQFPIGDTRVTAMDFRSVCPENLADSGRYLWIGFKDGSLHEIDIRNRMIVERYFHAHSGAIVAILRHGQAMWTLDETGTLQLWSTKSGASLKGKAAYTSVRTVIGVNTALVVDGLLWVGSNRSVHVFDPLNSVDTRRLTPERGLEPTRVTGMITCAVYLHHNPNFIYFGHDDGKISIYSRGNLKCLEVISISHYNLSGLLAVGDYLWASFKTGKVFVYDVHTRPWRVMKEWQAHKSPILELFLDRTSLWKEKRMQVSTMSGDGAVKIWDGLLMDDWLDAEMQRRIQQFSTFKQLSALICTWNAGASVPQKLSRDYEDARFIEKMILGANSPDIIVFGFQELVDLDNKGKASRSVAKGFFGKKKEKEPEEKAQAAAYLLWQNYLEKQVALASTDEAYTLLNVRSLVGLFTCVFVKKIIRSRIANVEASSVKTGLKGRYGNKGGIVIRFTIDDTSLCFINCHLAAGQKHVVQRNNDVFAILDQAGLSAPAEQPGKNNVFVSGGDGSMVLDHEICILNGDLNYRINGQRSNVLQDIKEGRLSKLLENDQLLGELKKNSTHRLRSFTEDPIRFPPTYKYDPGTDNYDSSEKMRIPAWCDRVYYRGLGSSDIKSLAYDAHLCRVSDHRPVSALLSMQVKTVNQDLRQQIYEEVIKTWIELANKTIVARKIQVLIEVTGSNEKECREVLRATKGQIVSDAALALI